MRAAVVTRELAPTATRPRRAVAHAEWGRVTVEWDYALSAARNHGAAVLCLQAMIGETVPRYPGTLPGDGGIAWVSLA